MGETLLGRNSLWAKPADTIKITDHIKYPLSMVIDPLDMVIIGLVFVSQNLTNAVQTSSRRVLNYCIVSKMRLQHVIVKIECIRQAKQSRS